MQIQLQQHPVNPQRTPTKSKRKVKREDQAHQNMF